ncbi:type II toxin-antitoxin system RelE/ParE family toxin [Aequorivita todarodis]|uniref:type II toxin-antitoxin system RelE/ParE family toxin n=1 Tax=Aequorivita todarodis TaxID=2036821 RepID=UPI002350AF8A|nr:type II toxin-antitoxin system RelE/ParE family toxin [Aequorivita todarodis]MDC8000567.1 type II toxin-antitoxin system RelE/ParE family toxin [Aequorivita todarodis]
MKQKFKVELMDEVDDFLNSLSDKARKKIIYNIRKAQVVNDNELFKKLNDNVWEFRTLHNKTYYRLFAFWDKTDKTETVVISTHGIEKKTPKTPPKEIAKTERIMKQYFAAKK